MNLAFQSQLQDASELRSELLEWDAFGTKTVEFERENVPFFVNEFWTSKQRAAHSLHEVSYRACFKPQLPEFFISRLTKPGDVVFDPFMGRGTTVLEAAMLGRVGLGNDVNPLSRMLVEPRIAPPTLSEIADRLAIIDLSTASSIFQELEAFYHPSTLIEICAFREYFLEREKLGKLDVLDKWIRMVAINRLTGHSKGFFSVYTLPPNQATSIARQLKINEKRNQTPDYRDTKGIILKKSKSLLKDWNGTAANEQAQFINHNMNDELAYSGPQVALSVTSPPFLNVVDYKSDNWLRCWFSGIDADQVEITQTPKIDAWRNLVKNTLVNVFKITKPNGYFAFEVGEIQNGALKLEEVVLDVAKETDWIPELVLINQQDFTKTSNAWGVSNNSKGTNTNRIALLRKP